MKKTLLILAICALVLAYRNSYCQVTINFVANVQGLTLEGLSHVQFYNTVSSQAKSKLKITVDDENGNSVIELMTPTFFLEPGMNELNKTAFAKAYLKFGSSSAAATFAQTGRFPAGTYDYCFELEVEGPKINDPSIYQNCFEAVIMPLTPLLLISPPDGSETCNTQPDFQWQQPMPVDKDLAYRLILTSVKDDQTAIEAINNNVPIIDIAGLRETILPYPTDVPRLEKDVNYAWQVTAYTGKTILEKSEIWTFRVHCDEAKTDSTYHSYREVKTAIDGNYYTANKVLRFALNNPYKARQLNYSIIDISAPEAEIKKLPEITVENGSNSIDLRLDNNKAFIPGHSYLMRISNIANHEVILRFIYND